ncbi:MAG: type II secretion system F family protein [Rhodospirillaceae bacterium]|nr:type II secretion system F family protein [Rhodospirillales bacterium]
MSPLELLLVGVAAIAAFASVMAVGLQLTSRDQLASRLKAVAARRQQLSARQRDGYRTNRFQPKRHVGWMKAVVNRMNLKDMLEAPELKHKLAQAGWRQSSAAVTFLFSRVAVPVVAFGLGLVYATSVFADWVFLQQAMLVLGAATFGNYLPGILLANAIQKRQQAVARSFPEGLDLMVICVEAGLSIEATLLKVAEELGSSAPVLGEEIGLTAAELAFLSDRRMAWDNLADRTGLPQVKSLCTALVQSEKYGTPVGQALRVLADENRTSRMAAAEKKAASLPAKLTVPMILFFLPVLFIVIAGPAGIRVSGLMK